MQVVIGTVKCNCINRFAIVEQATFLTYGLVVGPGLFGSK